MCDKGMHTADRWLIEAVDGHCYTPFASVDGFSKVFSLVHPYCLRFWFSLKFQIIQRSPY